MEEKVIDLTNIALQEFLGTANINLNKVKKVYPNLSITARGGELKIKGDEAEVLEVVLIFERLMAHFNQNHTVFPEFVDFLLKNKSQLENVERKSSFGTFLNSNSGDSIRPKNESQKLLVESFERFDLIFAIGAAGTGKTYLSVALAVKALKEKRVKKIVITRPVVEAGESLGFLPGDLKEKVDPYLRPIYDAFISLMGSEKTKLYEESGVIEIAPLAYMRGRTLDNAFVLLDEAQNTTAMQMRMFLTRMGPNAKVVITGDPSQIDLPSRVKSGLVEALDALKGVAGIKTITFTESEVIRHKLVGQIIGAYKTHDTK